MRKPKIVLAVNNCITNDPCALCGSRCDPCGLDYTLRGEKPHKRQRLNFSGLVEGAGRVLVCDTCAKKHAPDIVEARDAALKFAAYERETEAANHPPPTTVGKIGLPLIVPRCKTCTTPHAADGTPLPAGSRCLLRDVTNGANTKAAEEAIQYCPEFVRLLVRGRSKGELLEKYAGRNPKTFIQYDGFVETAADANSHPDKDGDALFSGITEELMHGSSVRVLVDPATSTGDAVRVLRKLAGWIRREHARFRQQATVPEAKSSNERLPF